MFDVFYSGKKPGIFAHERKADSIEHAQILCGTRYFWWITYLADYSTHDWDYQPVPWQSEYTHTWPSQHHEYSGTYLVPKSGEIKYHFHDKIIPNKSSTIHFYAAIPDTEFDYSWAPHPHDPPYIYVFGNQWWPAEKMPTIEYHVPGATERKYMTEPQAQLPKRHCNRWHTLIDCEWDYSWVPDPGDPPYIYVFGNQHWSAEKMPTVEYHVPGATERKYIRYPYAQLLPDAANWTVPPDIDAVDYTWVPDPGEPPYIYQFATQHQKTGGAVYTVPGATEVKYLEQIRLRTVSKATAVYEIDHLDGAVGQVPNSVKTVRYFDNYRDTLIRLAKSIGSDHEWVWVCSSICDYTGFDFSWHPEQWQATMLHVFPSNDQKFGDTFFMHVPTFAERAENKALLEWYDVNFVDKIVPRRLMPVIEHGGDSNVDAVKTTEWRGPLALFTTNGMPITIPAVNLWRSETKTITSLSAGASAVIVPRVAVPHIKTQLYDYPYIDKTQQRRHGDTNLDIVFISNGEANAELNYAALLDSTYNRNNLVHRVDNVKGRVAAYHAAAHKSTTPWFFAVFAKLQVEHNFNWDWQPDRMQQAKHYIFHAKNPVNGLEYGHQAMIAYNQNLVLTNPGVGLDFTLDSAHEVVPVNSGTAHYNIDPWSTWRTAFREVVKLCGSADVESQYRLGQWLDHKSTSKSNGEWSVWGAEDAVEYYESVKGNLTELRKSYEWDWLASYAFVKRNLLPDQQ